LVNYFADIMPESTPPDALVEWSEVLAFERLGQEKRL
jgi:hypothetical protein